MSGEKNQKPTQKKIEDARDKGQVPVSRDLARLVLLTVAGEAAFITEKYWREGIESLFLLGIMRIGQPFEQSLSELLASSTTVLLLAFIASLLICTVAIVAGHWGQFGVLFAPEAVIPSLDKIDPVNGTKQLFSMKKLTELLITVLKMVLIVSVIFVLAREQLPDIMSLSGGAPKNVHDGFITILRSIFHVVIGITFVLALIDFAVQYHFYKKELMMSFEDIKEELKETEGDPLIKMKRKMLARELAMTGAVTRTQEANAVVVNPTHFAVAMYYNPADAPLPVVVAKGKDEIAQAMIDCARRFGIPVIRHVWLARTLYATGRQDAIVPRASYEAVAYVYAVVNELVAMNDTGREVELESQGEPPDSHRA